MGVNSAEFPLHNVKR